MLRASIHCALLYPESAFQAEVLEDLVELSRHALGQLGVEDDGELDADLQVSTGAEFGEDLGPQAVPHLWWDSAHEPEAAGLGARGGRRVQLAGSVGGGKLVVNFVACNAPFLACNAAFTACNASFAPSED